MKASKLLTSSIWTPSQHGLIIWTLSYQCWTRSFGWSRSCEHLIVPILFYLCYICAGLWCTVKGLHSLSHLGQDKTRRDWRTPPELPRSTQDDLSQVSLFRKFQEKFGKKSGHEETSSTTQEKYCLVWNATQNLGSCQLGGWSWRSP